MKIKHHFFLSLVFVFLVAGNVSAARLSGLILLEVENKGAAWYVSPVDGKRYSLGRPVEALALVRKLALGVNSKSLAEIEKTKPARLSGRILLNVEDAGKAYYFNPRDKKLYYLGNPLMMFEVMKRAALGIKSADLVKIALALTEQADGQQAVVVATSSEQVANDYLAIEKKIQELVNTERVKNGLQALKWNDDLALAARKHSQDQAEENKQLISQQKLCSYPFIHHEGTVSGLYHADRLNGQGIYYQAASAENIALIPESKEASYRATGIEPRDCQSEINILNTLYEGEVKALPDEVSKIARVKAEVEKRAALTAKAPTIQIIENFNSTIEQIEESAVKGWMNSPGHRKNILNGDYDEAGLGMAKINGYYIFTQVFIKRAICGYKNGPCCQKEGYYPYCFVPMSCSSGLCGAD
jgi:uncharacterized protein YkwD